MKSTFVFTEIPNVSQYYGASQSGRIETRTNLTADLARDFAKATPKVAYYCQRDTSTYDFFTGVDFWLGRNDGHTTTVVSELADTSDEATKKEVLKQIRDRLWLDGALDTRGHSRNAQRTVTVGVLFCDFEDARGKPEDLKDLQTKLLGSSVAAGSPVYACIERESNGRVKLDVRFTNWITLSKRADFLVTNPPQGGNLHDITAILTAANAASPIPPEWEILVFAFPAASGVDVGSRYVGVRKITPRSGGTSREVRVACMDPKVYQEKSVDVKGASVNTTHKTTTHEILHALGLPDLYHTDANRSFGWSIMSDCRTAWHLTEIEKLALGWNDIEDYWVLRRGLLPVDDILTRAQDAGKKGVIVLPASNGLRPEIYAFERPQAIGRSETTKLAVEAEQKADPGLLVLMIRADDNLGRMVPFVAGRPTDPSEREARGGASRAALQSGGEFWSQGLSSRSTPGYPTSTGVRIRRVVGVDAAWEPPQQARTLREGQRIKNEVGTFELNTSGVPTIDGGPAIPLISQGRTYEESIDPKVREQDYGFRLDISNDNVVGLWLAGSEATTSPRRTFAAPANSRTGTTGEPVFTIESGGSSPRSKTVAVSRRNGSQITKLYDVLRRATYVRGDSIIESPLLKVAFEKDGNLAVRRTDKPSTNHQDFVTGTWQQHGEKFFDAIDIDGAGTIRMLDSFGTVLKTILAATTEVSAPCELVIQTGSTGASGSVVVQDAKARTVNTLLTWS